MSAGSYVFGLSKSRERGERGGGGLGLGLGLDIVYLVSIEIKKCAKEGEVEGGLSINRCVVPVHFVLCV